MEVETAVAETMEEEMDEKDRALEAWENEHSTKVETEVSKVGLRLQGMEENLAEAQRENEALRERSRDIAESKFANLENAVAGMDDEGKRQTVLEAMHELRANLLRETKEKERAVDELARIREEKAVADHEVKIARSKEIA